MKLNRHNYEEYFILYADNELSSDERRMVEEFANLNPDLKDELDTYLSTVLLPDTFVGFENKEELHRYDESLISYIDNELPAAEKSEFEKLVNATPSLQKELELYRKTKLLPEMDIVFENKSVLYRSTERRVVRMTWVRWAAAAVILLAVSITAITIFNKPAKTGQIAEGSQQVKPATQTKEDVANKDEKLIEAPALSTENDKKIDAGNLDQPTTVVKNTDKQKTDLPKDKKVIQIINQQERKDVIANNNEKTPSNNLPAPQYNQKPSDAIAIVNEPQKSNDPVTKTDTDPYNNQKATGDDKATFASLKNMEEEDADGGQNKKSRGLFRKLTRVFEKNTGIKATTDDDKLHIAAFTVKLK
jgi:hypothetical protein